MYVYLTGCFYYLLANLLPNKRSAIEALQLIAVAKTKHIREYGVEFLLKPFVDEINQLSVSTNKLHIIN